MDRLQIVMLGSGAVATHLGKALYGQGHRILQVYSRNLQHASTLSGQVEAEALDQLSKLNPKADLYIISVSDQAIAGLVDALPQTLACVVHTSGSTDIGVLEGRFSSWGVLYPLQTFSIQRDVDFSKIPILLEGDRPETESFLKLYMEELSRQVQLVESQQRGILHVAAVLACNFSNHLYALAQNLLEDHQLTFDLIRPLIQETAEKALQHAPASVQTGPAIRQDRNTMERHMVLLANRPDLQQLYKYLSESIQHNSGENVDDSL